MIRLIFHTGPRAGTEVTTSAESIRIGRNPEHSDVVLADAAVSLLDRVEHGRPVRLLGVRLEMVEPEGGYER